MPISKRDEIIAFHTIKDFEGESFFIPDYQRGYRWTEREVLDLLNDWNDFYKDKGNSYFMQPIVVKLRDDGSWEVVDGQQRLTTVLLILQALGETGKYQITYQVLNNSANNVADIKNCQNTDDINLFHMRQAYDTAVTWIGKDAKNFDSKEELSNFIFNKIKFLWYRADKADDSSGEYIFQRLNIGKIELTQSELIKALFLSDDNFAGAAVNHKEEFARQWDEFETMFQNDEFWYFLTDRKGSDFPTRIELLLEIMPQLYPKLFDSKEELDSKDGLFRAYYSVYRKDRNKLQQIWDKAIQFMDITRMWYEDVTFYHLIGFKIIDDKNDGRALLNIFKEWNNNRTVSGFITDYLVKGIVRKHAPAFRDNAGKVYGHAEESGGWKDEKREAYGPLLLSNVLQVLRQNKTHENNPDYAQGIFYKFPFHLFKKQIKGKGKGWDVEHVTTATDNDLEDVKAQREWICSAYLSLTSDERVEFNDVQKENISQFFKKDNNNTDTSDIFDNLYKDLTGRLGINVSDTFSDEQKNKISNYVLLDYSTNREYKNAIFPTKRQHIRNKEHGKLMTAQWDTESQKIKIIEEEANSAFVPPCTKDVFMKTYSNVVSNSMAWTPDDAAEYASYLTELFNWFKEKYSNL